MTITKLKPDLDRQSDNRQSYEEVYAAIREEEMRSKDIQINFEQSYPDVTTEANVYDILAELNAKKPDILEKLRDAEKGTAGKYQPKKRHNEG